MSMAKSDLPAYPGWVRSGRIVRFWAITGTVAVLAAAAALVWVPAAIILALLSLPFFYIAVVLSWSARRLGPSGGDVQRRIHQLIADAIGTCGRLLDVGCGSGQLVIRLARGGQGEFVGLDYWGEDWEYSQAQAERNASLEGVANLSFARGSASSLPFPDGSFGRVVSCMTFHEVQDVADKTLSLGEALRVLEPGGRFAFVDLFDDPQFYPSRDAALAAIAAAGGTVDSATNLRDSLDLRFPLTLTKVLRHAVLVTGAKAAA